MRNKIVFGLGSNQGDRQKFLDLAVQNLKNNLHLTNIKKSSFLENKALLLPGSPPEWDIDFLNIAVSADINLNDFPPIKILEIIQKIEIDLGRVQRGKWGPREIDIDILAIENLKINLGGKLQIPHPELFNRDFFIKTFAEIEADLLTNLRNDQRS